MHTQQKAAQLFNQTHPDRPPSLQDVVSRIEEKIRNIARVEIYLNQIALVNPDRSNQKVLSTQRKKTGIL